MIFERKSIKYMIKACLCVQSASQSHCLPLLGSQDICYPMTPSFPPSNNTFNIQSYRDGHESTFRHGWASASCSGKPPPMPRVLMHLTRLGTSNPGNAAKGFFCGYICRCILIFIQDPRRPVSWQQAGRQTTLLLSHSNYLIYIFIEQYVFEK